MPSAHIPEPSMFNLPKRLETKSAASFTGRDEEQFAAIAAALHEQTECLRKRLSIRRKAAVHLGGEAVERDQEIRRLSSRLSFLERFGADLCLGRLVMDSRSDPIYIGRSALRATSGEQLLLDWRTPAARAFFAATRADPMGVASRRRYRWDNGQVSDYWDEAFVAVDSHESITYDDESAFIASLGADRSGRMRDVLATIQADQDAIIRASPRGPLVVDGGPGTGKTVVALHRAAYLLHSEPQISGAGGVLVVGPNAAYLRYVDDVLPGLGEENVQLATLVDLVPEGSGPLAREAPGAAVLKGTRQMVEAVAAAVRFYEEPPHERLTVETSFGDALLGPEDWAGAFGAVGTDAPHNEALPLVEEAVSEVLLTKLELEEENDRVRARKEIRRDPELRACVRKAWPVLDPRDLIGDLWTVPAYLAMCAPHLSADEVDLMQRTHAREWTAADLPLLDAARFRLGSSGDARQEETRARERRREQAEMDAVVADLMAADDSEMQVMAMLRGQDMRGALEFVHQRERSRSERLAGPFGHVVADEAQELTEAQWAMIARRTTASSVTVVGDRAQSRLGYGDMWEERLAWVGLKGARVATLHINYRTPEEIMGEAEPVIRAVYPQANVPVSVRSGGFPVHHVRIGEWREILMRWLAGSGGGTACVVASASRVGDLREAFRSGCVGIGADRRDQERERVVFGAPGDVKGLEFDVVILVEPEEWGGGVAAAVDRYVAMTRATKRLVIASA